MARGTCTDWPSTPESRMDIPAEIQSGVRRAVPAEAAQIVSVHSALRPSGCVPIQPSGTTTQPPPQKKIPRKPPAIPTVGSTPSVCRTGIQLAVTTRFKKKCAILEICVSVFKECTRLNANSQPLATARFIHWLHRWAQINDDDGDSPQGGNQGLLVFRAAWIFGRQLDRISQ